MRFRYRFASLSVSNFEQFCYKWSGCFLRFWFLSQKWGYQIVFRGCQMKYLFGLTLFLLIGGCAPLLLEDHVISADEVWRGEVRIHGLVTVKKGARLEIRPGTQVIFEPLDRDGDGIGDGELLVEGSLQAIGTAERPILLTSGADNPQPQDWKFLYLDFAKQVEIAHLISEYAYSGVQIHFCKAKVTDSEFRYNVDGVRFSTVNIELANNYIHHNRHGIRFEERRGSGRVHHNRVSDNRIGIFAVTKSENRTLFEYNNIENNSDYHIKLGLEQRQDLSFPRNWWGGIAGDLLPELVFDRKYDQNLGTVTLPDPLPGPITLDF